jgi:hypothetical protein
MTFLQKLDSLWKSRSASVVGVFLVFFSMASTPPGHALLNTLHVPQSWQDSIDQVQSILIFLGIGLSARGVGALGGATKNPPKGQNADTGSVDGADQNGGVKGAGPSTP